LHWYREINHSGEYSSNEWTITTVSARRPSGTINANIYKADIRVRARNAGTRTPGEWSALLHLSTEREETKRLSLVKVGGKSTKAMLRDEEANAKGSEEHTQEAMGVAVSP
jgi:hypothetical protein